MGYKDILFIFRMNSLDSKNWIDALAESLGVTDPRPVIEEWARTSAGYLEVWRRVIAGLEEVGNEELALEFKRREGDARRWLLKQRITMETPLERAFCRVFALERGTPPANGDLREFLQAKYDDCGVAAEVLRKMVAQLDEMTQAASEGVEKDELIFLRGALDSVNGTDAARRLAYRGVAIDGERGMAVGRLKPGDSEQGQRARKAALIKRAKFKMMKLEERRIKEAKARQYPYAGRRYDVQDYKGHHPYITSMAAANYARVLSAAGSRWRYGDRAYFFKVKLEFEGRFPKEYVYLEPDFSIYDEADQLVRIVVLADGNRMERSLHGNSWSELEALNEMHPELDIENVDENDHYQGPEKLAREGSNIQNDPQRFALMGDCPCPLCAGTRFHPDFERVPGHLGAVRRR